jgi:hypothetical protein
MNCQLANWTILQAELLGEAKALRKEYEEALKKALAVYQ